MQFTKMHGAGNDYLYVYGEVPANIEEICVKLSDRHFGAGSDGMIYISPCEDADFQMRIFNADGSEAKMCGNGIRCVGKYVYEKGYTDKKVLKIKTLSGYKTLHLEVVFNKVKSVSVEMGHALVSPETTLSSLGESLTLTPVDMGNPHAVIFCEDAEAAAVERVGKGLQTHPAFAGGVNAEFVSVLAPGKLRMRVWERGSGITLACGTGACATSAAAVAKGICLPGKPVEIVADGGSLWITVEEDNAVKMSGPAAFVYEGDTPLC